jgi:two-component system alkaline phosphatase synthesis response regulator PhoP
MADRVVLVIDDEKEVCRIIKEGLERRGRFKIITAYNGQDGFHMAQRAQPDLVLLDIDMPWMNGFRVLELLKEDSKTYSIPVFMLTGHNDDDYKIAASRLYCEDYITKPMSLKELEAKIDVVLARCGI